MAAYVHIKYSTYQFSEESKGGGGESTLPPRFLRYRKKRGPERVKHVFTLTIVRFKNWKNWIRPGKNSRILKVPKMEPEQKFSVSATLPPILACLNPDDSEMNRILPIKHSFPQFKAL